MTAHDAQDAAADRFRAEIANREREHLNGVSAAVFATHALRPVEEVLAELLARSATATYQPSAEALRPAAFAIHRGRRFTFV